MIQIYPCDVYQLTFLTKISNQDSSKFLKYYKKKKLLTKYVLQKLEDDFDIVLVLFLFVKR